MGPNNILNLDLESKFANQSDSFKTFEEYKKKMKKTRRKISKPPIGMINKTFRLKFLYENGCFTLNETNDYLMNIFSFIPIEDIEKIYNTCLEFTLCALIMFKKNISLKYCEICRYIASDGSLINTGFKLDNLVKCSSCKNDICKKCQLVCKTCQLLCNCCKEVGECSNCICKCEFCGTYCCLYRCLYLCNICKYFYCYECSEKKGKQIIGCSSCKKQNKC
jgi:hypothetical protein